MKKFISIISLIFILFISVPSVNAQMMNSGATNSDEVQSENHETLNVVLPEILRKYNVYKIQELDCKVITDEDFERVGEAAMESNHPGEAHEAMDEMMARLLTPERSDVGQGGEGSESLRAAHVNMGKNYLGCQSETGERYGMMGNYRNQKGGVANMMGWGYGVNVLGYSGFGILGFLIWIVVLIDLILLGAWLWKQIKKK